MALFSCMPVKLPLPWIEAVAAAGKAETWMNRVFALFKILLWSMTLKQGVLYLGPFKPLPIFTTPTESIAALSFQQSSQVPITPFLFSFNPNHFVWNTIHYHSNNHCAGPLAAVAPLRAR